MSQAYGGFAIVTDRVVSKDEVHFIVLPSSTSYLKLVDVPLKPGGVLPLVEEIMAGILQAGLKDTIVLQGPPRAVQDSHASDMAMVYLNITDSVSRARAKVLLHCAIRFGLYACPFRAAWANPGLALCQRCWKWVTWKWHAMLLRLSAPLVGGLTTRNTTGLSPGVARATRKLSPPNPPMAKDLPCPHAHRCINCGNEHAADDRRCNPWRHQFDQDWIKARYAEVSANHHSRSPPYNPFPTGSRGHP